MQIQEAARLTGLSASTIRFYERKGLLAPGRREENSYRDYSAKDVERLKEIMLYRKMDIPVEVIFLLQKGELSLAEVLERQRQELVSRIEVLEGSLALLEEIQREQDPGKLDVDRYLQYVKEEEEQGRHFAQAEELLDDFVYSTAAGALLQRDPALFYFFYKRPALKRVLFVLWLGITVLIPLGNILEIVIYREQWKAPGLIFWAGYLVWVAASFVLFRRRKRSLA